MRRTDRWMPTALSLVVCFTFGYSCSHFGVSFPMTMAQCAAMGAAIGVGAVRV